HHTLNRWDTKQNGAMPGLCANELPDLMHLPTLSTLQASRLVLTDELPKDSMHRAEAIVDSISSGHFYCTHAVFGGTPEFSFRAIHKDIETGRAGDKLSFDEVSSFEILGPEFESARVFSVLYRNGEEVSRALNSPLIYQDPLPGIYRVEILVEVPNLFWGHRLAPLVYSNQITVLPVRSAQLQ
ncbi:hypothetical protein KAI87_17575, partial [Myxococcota bacterium]|nr:hypothetical protein [Myxococcota bacterium]